MDTNLFVKSFPRLYHMAHKDALPSILKHGLMSTSALLDLYEMADKEREAIETRMRPESVTLRHKVHGRAVVRDQKPIVNDARLQKSLIGKTTTTQFHQLLNSMVFFWVNPARLDGLRNAKAYRAEPQLVLTLDTKALVEANEKNMYLCPMNSGACRPIAHPRSVDMFQTIKEYDFEFWRQRKGGAEKAVVECTVSGKVSNVGRLLLETEIVTPGG